MKFMDYRLTYSRLVVSRQSLGRQKLPKSHEDYVRLETHHILPKCQGGSNELSNLVLLTVREHFIAHLLLTASYPDSVGLAYAAHKMTHRNGIPVSSRTANRLKRSHSEKVSRWQLDAAESGRHNWQVPGFRESQNQRTKERNSKQLEAGIHNWQSDEAKKFHSERNVILLAAGKHPFQSKENLKLSSERCKQQVQCSHCAKIGNKVAMSRWHFDNCLQHPDNLGLTRQQIKAKRQAL